ncbi:MAG: hypothetical protein ABIH82_05940, partial [Candidatus Woesearchaeota archaeon]
LFAFAGVMYVTKIIKKDALETEGASAIEDVPSQFRPVRLYTEDCLREVAEKGLKVLGQQGGYIYVDLIGEYDQENPTDSDGVNLGNMKVPYWHYSKPENKLNSIAYSSLQPKLFDDGKEGSEMSIEAQLSRYVEQHVGECLADYVRFSEQGINVVAEPVQNVRAQVGDDSVVFTLTMDVEASQAGATEQFNEFFIRVPLKLKHYYEVAERIKKSQQDYFFLEAQFLSLLGGYTTIPDITLLPPMNAMTFEVAGTKFWQVEDVEEKLTQLISSNIPMLQILGAHNLQYYDYPVTDLSGLFQQSYNNNIITNIDQVEDVEVRFDYFGWKPYYDFNDVDGLITSQNTLVQRWFLPPLGTQRFYTTYDISYPVLITIDDPLALDNEGYKFIIALESNIRNNDPVLTDQTLPPPIAAFSESMVCDSNKRNSEVIDVKVVDSFTKESLDLVRIGFTIPNQDECLIGLTDNAGEHEGQYPEVYGGVMSFLKEDYLEGFYPIDTYDMPQSNNIIGYAVAGVEEPVIELHRYKEVNVTIKKKKISKCIIPLECVYSVGTVGLIIPFKDISCKEAERRCFFDSGASLFGLPEHVKRIEVNGTMSKYNDYYFSEADFDLNEKESALIALKKVADVNENVISKDQTIPIYVNGNEKTPIKLVPGIYAVDGMLSLNDEIVVADEERSVSFDIITWEKDFKYEMNGTKLEKFMSGSLKWDEPRYYFKITPEDLYTNEELTFYIPSYAIEDVPLYIETKIYECAGAIGWGVLAGCVKKTIQSNGRLIEDLMMMTYVNDISKMKRRSLEPVWG